MPGLVVEPITRVFAETVFAKPLHKQKRKRSLKSRVFEGIRLGIEPITPEHRVAVLGGGPVVRVRMVMGKPDSEKWRLEGVKSIQATPRRPRLECRWGWVRATQSACT